MKRIVSYFALSSLVMLTIITNGIGQNLRWDNIEAGDITINFQIPTTWSGLKKDDDYLKYSILSDNNSHIYSIEISNILLNSPENSKMFKSNEFYDQLVKFHLTHEKAIELSCGNIIPELIQPEYVTSAGIPKIRYKGPTDIEGFECDSYAILHLNYNRVLLINIYGGHISQQDESSIKNHNAWSQFVKSLYIIED